MSVAVLPDAERIVSTFLRARPELSALVDDRVFTELPKREADRVFPLVRLSRVGGGAVEAPSTLDRALLSFDVWGGSKFQARQIAATIAALLDQGIAGFSAHDGYATGASPGSLRYLPDDSFEDGRSRPRYVLDAVVYFRPSP